MTKGCISFVNGTITTYETSTVKCMLLGLYTLFGTDPIIHIEYEKKRFIEGF